MLTKEPSLQFVASQDLADDQIVGPVIPPPRSARREVTAVANNDLVCIEQSRQLHRHFFAAPWGSSYAGGLRHIGRHGHADSAEQLNSLCDCIHQVRLFFKVLVE